MAWPLVLTRREPQLATVPRCKFLKTRTLRVREATWPGKGPVGVASLLRAASLHPVLGHAGTARHFLSLSRAQPQPSTHGLPRPWMKAVTGNKGPVSACSGSHPLARPWHRRTGAPRKPESRSS